MQAQVARWGDSLALRLPKELALRLGLVEGSRVELTAERSRIVITAERPVYALDELLKGIRPGELQQAFDWGEDAGREAIDRSHWRPAISSGPASIRASPAKQGGRRPALILSPRAFQEATGMAIVCPITSRVRPFPTSVVLPAGLPIHGEALVSHVRSIDLLARPVRAINASVPPATLAEVRAKLAALTGIAG